jgi:reactive intermediate/imine deaminase
MDTKQIIRAELAPRPLGRYSQAVRVGDVVYISGQLPLDPETMTLVAGNTERRIHQVFKNIEQICLSAEGSLADIVKLTVYLTELSLATTVNDIMDFYFQPPYPARSVVEVSQLPQKSVIEIDAVMVVKK